MTFFSRKMPSLVVYQGEQGERSEDPMIPTLSRVGWGAGSPKNQTPGQDFARAADSPGSNVCKTTRCWFFGFFVFFFCRTVGSAAPGDDKIWRISAPSCRSAQAPLRSRALHGACSCLMAARNTQRISKGRDIHRLQLQIPPTAGLREFCFQRPLLRLKPALRRSFLILGRGRNAL